MPPNIARTPSLRFGRWDASRSPFLGISRTRGFEFFLLSSRATPAHLPVPRRALARSAARAIGHLIYCDNEHRVQRQNLVLEGPGSMVLRYRSGEAQPRPASHIKARDLWLGNDPSGCSDRQNRVEDFLVSQRWPLHCTHQSERPKSKKP